MMKRILSMLIVAAGLWATGTGLSLAQCSGQFPSGTVCGNSTGALKVPSALPIIGLGDNMADAISRWGGTRLPLLFMDRLVNWFPINDNTVVDFTTLTAVAQGGLGNQYASFNARPITTSTAFDWNHIAEFEGQTQYFGTGVLGHHYSLLSFPTFNGPTTVRDAVYVADAQGSGTLTTQHGVYCVNMVHASSNWCIYADGSTPNYFGGNVLMGTSVTPASGPKLTITKNVSASVAPAFSGTLLQITNVDGTGTQLEINAFGTGAVPSVIGRAARGTQASPSALQSGDTLTSWLGNGYGTSAFGTFDGITQLNAIENFTNAARGTAWDFFTNAIGGTTLTRRARMASGLIVGSTGTDMGAGTVNVSGNYYVNGVAAATTVNGQSCALGGSCTVTAVASSIIVGTTTVGSGTNTALLFNNAGVLGNVITLPAANFPALTGDITTIAGALGTTLATVNSNVGTFGSATQSSQVTVNAKGLVTAAANVTVTPAVGSITGLGTGVATWLATPSSANLAAAVTDETGSGALVFGTTPTLATPIINGLPTGTGVATANTASTLVARDGSGNFSAGTITAALSGNATTATSSTSATNATNTAITDDTTTNATMNVTWVTSNTGNLPQKVTSTKLTFNPSTGVLSSTSFTGAGTGLTGTAASLTAGNVTTNANLTGAVTSIGNATSLGSFSSANLLTALTDETGSGVAVFGTSPVLSTVDARGTWTTGTSWTLPAHTLGGTISGGGNQINNVIIGTTTPLAGFFTTLSATTSLTSPLQIGGTGTTGTQLTLQTTTGVGTTDALAIKGGNNGATTFATINATGIGIGAAPTQAFTGSFSSTTLNGATLQNTNSGGVVSWQAQNDGGTINEFGVRGSARASYGTLVANDAYLYTGSNMTFMADASGIMKWATGGNALRMQLSAAGGLSIGSTTDPGAGGLQINGQTFVPNAAADTATVDSTACIATTGGKLLKGTGTLGICLGTSGRQFKTAFAPMEAGIDDIAKIKLWNYRYRKGYGDGGERVQYGPTAQDVESVLPDLVRYDENRVPINYDIGAFVPISLHALQQLNERLQKLEQRH